MSKHNCDEPHAEATDPLPLNWPVVAHLTNRDEVLEEAASICEGLETWTEAMHDTKRAAAMKIRAAKSGAKP
jgi:hypothetical protein